MSKSKKDFHHIRVRILNEDYFVDVCWGDPVEACAFARAKFEDREIKLDVFEDKRGLTVYRKHYNPMIFVSTEYCSKRCSEKHFFATLAHEAVHAVCDIWGKVEENTTGEVFAHSVGAVVAAVERIKNK